MNCLLQVIIYFFGESIVDLLKEHDFLYVPRGFKYPTTHIEAVNNIIYSKGYLLTTVHENFEFVNNENVVEKQYINRNFHFVRYLQSKYNAICLDFERQHALGWIQKEQKFFNNGRITFDYDGDIAVWFFIIPVPNEAHVGRVGEDSLKSRT